MSKKIRKRKSLKAKHLLKNDGIYDRKALTLKAPVTGETFLGFPLRNVNQLWEWDTLKDVNFK